LLYLVIRIFIRFIFIQKMIYTVDPGSATGKRSGAAFASVKISTTATIPNPTSEKIYFSEILPINISTILVTNKMAAVEKLAGKINVQMKIAGMMTGKNPT